MPKIKTHRGAAKRFKRVGKKLKRVKFRRAERNHINTKNTPKQVRQRRKNGLLKLMDAKKIIRMLVG